MAIEKQVENTTGGGLKRGSVLVKTDSTIAVAQAAASAGTVALTTPVPKSVRSTVRALDANRAETAVLVDVQGRVISNGADPSTLTIYLWCADAGGITVPANGFLLVEYEWNESVLSD